MNENDILASYVNSTTNQRSRQNDASIIRIPRIILTVLATIVKLCCAITALLCVYEKKMSILFKAKIT